MKESKKYLWIIGLVIILEVFLFNFRHWESLLFTHNENYTVMYGEGLLKIDEDTYRIQDTENAYIELLGLNCEVKNVLCDFESTEAHSIIPLHFQYTDSANSEYRGLPSIEVVHRVPESKYIRVHFSGESSKLKIWLEEDEGVDIKIHKLDINTIRPLMINGLRMFIMTIAICLLTTFRPKSKIYNETIDVKNRKHKILVAGMLVLNMGLVGIVGMSSLQHRTWEQDTWQAHAQYEDLADALIDGHFYLNLTPSETLKQMDNPYDCTLREILHEKNNESYYFDFAYYNGKYYSYFGILPALLFFVPFKLIMGYHLQTWIPVLLCGIIYCFASFWFIYELIKKYFKGVSVGLYTLLSSVFIVSSQIVYLVFFGNVYSMPIMLGLLLGILGLSCWLRASNAEMKIQKKYLVLGSICIALIMACRPQLAIILLFAFPLFWKEIKEKYFFSIRGMANTCCVIIPFLIIGFGIMYYNFARFGSPFDFGANYNLTSNDMTHRGVILSRFTLGIYEYLFQPLKITSKFPFLNIIELQTEYQGYISSEPLFGGFLWFNLVSLFGFGIFKKRKCVSRNNCWGLACTSLLSGCFIIALTIQMSGLTQRYMSDFGWLLLIPSVLCILSLEQEYRMNGDKEKRKLLLETVILLSAITVVLGYFNIFILERYGSLSYTNPRLFYIMKYMFFHL